MNKEQLEKRKKLIAELILENEFYVPMKTKEIAILLQIPKSQRGELQEVLDSLVSDGTIGISKKGKYGKPDNTAVVGIFTSTRRGFGFVTVDGWDEDIFIQESDTGGAFHMDKVKVTITHKKQGNKRCEGKVIGVLQHQLTELVGTFQKSRTYGFVVPDNGKIPVDIFVPQEKSMGAMNGHKVVVKITNYGSHGKNPEGQVVDIIGHINDPGTDVLSIVKAYDLPVEFPDNVIQYLKNVPEEVDEKDKAGRVNKPHLARFLEENIENQTEYEFWNGSGWIKGNETAATPLFNDIYLENFPSLIIQNLKNGYCSISIVHAMISHSEQQIIL